MQLIRQEAENFLYDKENILIADVRTPLEYSLGHIPGAILFPLFSNEERAEVGRLYAIYGNEKAMEKGYEIAGKKLNQYLTEAIKIAPERILSIYCWRGGMRSASLAWLLGFSGFEIHVLEGGYKAYRSYCRSSYAIKPQMILLGGYTGSGKTEILSYLEKKGEQVINLEELSNHKGSAFGWIGEGSQPSQEQFENNLADRWRRLDPNKTVWLEDESINIGNIQIPRPLFSQMEHAPVIVLEAEKSLRVERLVRDYQSASKQDLLIVFNRISKRIGLGRCREAIEAIERNELHSAADIALAYYDKAYATQLMKRPSNKLYPLEYSVNLEVLTNRILDYRSRIDH